MSTFLSLTTENASATTFAFPPVTFFAWARALSATTVMVIARPARLWISSALRDRTSQVPPPTVPIPSRPTLMGFISLQAQFEVTLDVGPFLREHAVHHGGRGITKTARPVVADHAVLLRAQRLDRSLRAEIEIVGTQADHLAAEFFKAMAEQEKLANRVHVRTLAALRIPGIADLDPVGHGDDVVVARAADDFAALQVAHRPGQHFTLLLFFQSLRNISGNLAGLGDRRKKQFPKLAVLRRVDQAFFMLLRKRLQPNAAAFQPDRDRLDHAAPRNSPSFLNMSRIPLTAWRRRCSFSISAMRTWSSPWSPKPMPGATAILAPSSRRLVNSIEPSLA